MITMIFAIAAIYFACRLFLLRRSVKKAGRELAEISRDLEENRVVRLPVPERGMEELLQAMNQNLKDIRAERRSYREKEVRLKEQVENVSHDLRTPLTAILGYLKMIDAESLSAEEQEYLEIAIKKSYTLQNLVTQFYDLSRVTAEDFQLKRTALDGARMVRECCLEHYLLFEQAQKDLQMDIPDTPVMLYGNRDALERIFTNLLQNSVRYARTRLWISMRREADSVVLAFKNDIDPASETPDAERLFDRFYMQEESRSRGGSGLGLTISRHLAEHMGGTMDAEYVKEEGNQYLVFTVRLLA